MLRFRPMVTTTMGKVEDTRIGLDWIAGGGGVDKSERVALSLSIVFPSPPPPQHCITSKLLAGDWYGRAP